MNYIEESFETNGRLVVCDTSNIQNGRIFDVKPGVWKAAYAKNSDKNEEDAPVKQVITRLIAFYDGGIGNRSETKESILIDSGMIGILDCDTFKDIPEKDPNFCEECDLLTCILVKNPNFVPFSYASNIKPEEQDFSYFDAKFKYMENRQISQEYIIDITPSIIRDRGVVTTNCCVEKKYPITVSRDKNGEIVKIEINF